MTKKRYKRVTICLTEQEHAILRKLAYISEKSMSDLIRHAFPCLVKLREEEQTTIAKSS